MPPALPPVRTRSTEPPQRMAPWKGSDPTTVASERRERNGAASVSATLPKPRKPDSLQWQRSFGVRRGAKEQLCERSQRRSMIDNGPSGRSPFQRRRKGNSSGKQRRQTGSLYQSLNVARQQNETVRKSDGKSPHAVRRSGEAVPGVDDEALPELDVPDVQDGQLRKVAATAPSGDDELRRQAAALRIQRFVRRVLSAGIVARQNFWPQHPQSRPGTSLPSLDASASIWDGVGEDAHAAFQRSKPIDRLLHGEDSSRLQFYQLYSEHLDWMDEESHADLGLRRVQADGWRREEILAILHQLSQSMTAQDVRERCADVGIVLSVRESENPHKVRQILREHLQQRRREHKLRDSPRVTTGETQNCMRVAAVHPAARAKRLELMAKQGSAHHHFLEECLQRGVYPLPIMLQQPRNDLDEKVLDLAHYRMGDEIAAALAAGLNKRAAHMQIETLILTDNKLSGPQDLLRSQRPQHASRCLLSSGADALASIIKQNASSITHLDLSENPLGPTGCQVLATAFANSSQALAVETLRLNNCKLGDRGTCAILGLLSEWCPYLKSLDIGRNNLGQGGSAALAMEEILLNETVPLATLSLKYNNFGEKHMQRLALAIPENTFLTHLDLSWNSVGCGGAMILAQSLRTNETLRVLNVSHDQIQEKGAFVLADMLKENRGLEQLILSDNPIGQRGGRAILRAINRMVELGTAQTRQVVLSQCNYNFTTPDKIFDPATPGGTYECDLSKPYDRAVAWELVELAWQEEGENWENETIDNQPFDLPEPERGQTWGRHPSYGSGCWYQLPAEGVLRVTYVQTPKVPRFSDCIDREMLDKLIELMSDKNISDHGTMLVNLASFDFYFTAEMACTLTILTADTLNKVACLTALIPRIIDPINISADYYDWMTTSELAAFEGRAPSLFNFIPTNPTDHYKLELGRTDHRRMLSRLVCFCAEDKAFRQKHNLYDTSQKGDGEGWRNETMTTSEKLMGPPTVNDRVDWNAPQKQYQAFQPVPWDIKEEDCTGGRLKYGTLEFDFVSTNVAHRIVGQAPMSQAVFRLFIRELQDIEASVTALDTGTDTVKKHKRHGSEGRTRASTQTTLMPSSANVDSDTSAFQPETETKFCLEDLQNIAKVQSLVRGRVARNSTQGIRATPRAMLRRGAAQIIHAERLKFQRYSKARVSEVQAEKQQKKDAAQAMHGWRSDGANTISSSGSFSAHPRVGHSATKIRQEKHGFGRTSSPPDVADPQAREEFFRSKIVPQHRPCWWTPSQGKRVSAPGNKAAKNMVRDKQLQMLRRSTMQYFFSTRQVMTILDVIDAGPNKQGHVEALVILFAVITDVEQMDFPEILGHTTYDKDGNHLVDWNELRALRQAQNPWVVLESRLGPANLFNPIRPEREYALDLRQHDCRIVAQCLVVLSAERGENLLYTTYNGLPFDVGAKWIDAVPDVGMFCGQYVTPEGCALKSLRLAIARRLLMPGYGRWRAVPLHLRSLDEDWRAQEASIGLEHCVIDADGSLVERDETIETQEILSTGGLLAVMRFAQKLTASTRVHTREVYQVDMTKAESLDVAVKLSLAVQRFKSMGTKKAQVMDVPCNNAQTSLSALQTSVEGTTIEQHSTPPLQSL